MKRLLQLVLFSIGVLLGISAWAAHTETTHTGTTQTETTQRIVVGTSLIQDIVNDLTSGQARLLTIVPGTSCPGHDDMKAADVIFAAQSQLALIHVYQQHIPAFSHLLKAAEGNSLRVEKLAIKGNWMAPPVQREATLRIAQILKEVYPKYADVIDARARSRLIRISAAEREAQQQLAPLVGMTVIAAKMQTDFLKWAGLNVPVSYGALDEVTPNAMVAALREVRGDKIIGVVDNVQSGAETGLPLAEELQVRHVTLSNFPGSASNVPDYFSLLHANVQTLLRLLPRHS